MDDTKQQNFSSTANPSPRRISDQIYILHKFGTKHRTPNTAVGCSNSRANPRAHALQPTRLKYSKRGRDDGTIR